MNIDTPETDRLAVGLADSPLNIETAAEHLLDHARKLERERDQARRNAEVERLSGIAVVQTCRELENVLKTYRRIWERLPEHVKVDQISAMKDWSTHDYEVMMAEQDKISSKTRYC